MINSNIILSVVEIVIDQCHSWFCSMAKKLHSPIVNSVIFKYWSKYHAYAMVSAKKNHKSLFKTRPINSARLRATHSSFQKKKRFKKNLSSASDHRDVFLDSPALIFIDYTVFYFMLQAFYLEITVHLSFITKLWITEKKTWCLSRPSQSQDMNIIENGWPHHERERNDSLPQHYIQSFYASIPNRHRKIIRSKDHATKCGS